MTTKRFLVINGPTFERLCDSLKYTNDQNGARVPVTFTIENGLRSLVVDFIVGGITYIVGGRQQVIVTGHAYDLTQAPVILLYRADGAGETKGHLTFDE